MPLNGNALLKAALLGLLLTALTIGLTFIPILGIVCCCLGGLVFALAGASYGLFAKRAGAPANVGPATLGGALVGLISGTGGGLLYGIIVRPTGPGFDGLPRETLFQLRRAGLPPEMLQPAALARIGLVAFVLIVISSLAAGLFLGALGGLLYGAIAGGPADQVQTPSELPPP